MKLLIKSGLVLLTALFVVGCSKNVTLPPEAFALGDKGCGAYSSEMVSVAGKLHFPSFKEELVFVCQSPVDVKQEMVLSLSFRNKR